MLVQYGKGGGRTQSAGVDTTASTGTSCATDGSTANTKGTWVSLLASTTFTSRGFYVQGHVDTAHNGLFDIGLSFDSGSTWSAILSNIPCAVDNVASHQNRTHMWVPLRVPAGCAVGARMQGSNTTATAHVLVTLVERTWGQHPGYAVATTYGANTGSSRGTALDAGGSANTLPANYVQITSSTSNALRHLGIAFSSVNQAAGSTPTGILLHVAKGAAASEVDIAAALWGGSGNPPALPRGWDLPVSLAAGTRLAAKHQCTSTTANTQPRVMDLVLIGYE